ncbi:MAG: MATE family efflux transporter [Planctomycetes bacterium]|nr:MATE family efflux transporter [Planctomycetota bacterium]
MPDAALQPSPAPFSLAAFGEVWSIAWPTVLTMTSYTVMQFVDSLMVGQVGALEVAAQGNGGIWVFTPIAVAMGFLTVVNTYVAQNLGAGKPENGPKYAWAALWISLAAWIVILLPMALGLRSLFEIIHADAGPESARLIALESDYGRILMLGAIFTLGGRGMHHFFFGLHRPKVVTLSAIVGNGVNILANYVLIFGENGLPLLNLPGVPGVPALGLRGAAIGTVLGSFVELAIPFAVFLGPRLNAELKTRGAWRPRLGPMRDLYRIGWPGALQFGNEIVCWALFMTVLVGTFGPDHMTAAWIVLKYMHLSFMPAVGFSVAVTSLVGKYIGAGNPDVGVARARLGLLMSVGYMTVCAAVFYVLREPLVAVFVGERVDAEQARNIIDIGAKLMICAALFQTVDAFGIVYNGALRGAGDTVWPGIVTVIFSWVFIIGGGYLAVGLRPEWESVGPWIAAAVYIIVFGVTMAWRFESGRWRSIKLLAPEEREAARVAPLGPGLPPGEAEAAVRDIAEELAGPGPG